jgi:integrase
MRKLKILNGYHLGRRNGHLEANLWQDGKRVQRRRLVGMHSEDEARQLIRRLNTEAAKTDNDKLTCDKLFGLYIDDRTREEKVSVFRMVQVRAVIKHHFGHLQPDQIDKKLCDDYFKDRRKLGVKNATIRTELAYLSAALTFAREMKIIAHAPRIWRPSQGRPRSAVEDYHLSRSEAELILADAKKTHHVWVFTHLGLGTAGRPSHILQLTWDRVDLLGRSLNLDDPKRDRTAKGRARVPINDELYEVLTEAKRIATNKYVVEWNGEPVKSVKKAFQRTAERTGIKVSPYVLRHTAAVWMAEAGVPMEKIAQYMGHTNPAITFKVYARFSPGHMRDASDALLVRGSDQFPGHT